MSKHIPKDIISNTCCILLVMQIPQCLCQATLWHYNYAQYSSKCNQPCSSQSYRLPFDANYNHHSCLKMVPIILTAASKQRQTYPQTTAMLPEHTDIASNTKRHVIFIMPLVIANTVLLTNVLYMTTLSFFLSFLLSPSLSLRRPSRGGSPDSFSSGVAVTLCGMEGRCVCAAAGCDFSRWPFWSAREAAAAAIWWHCANSQGWFSVWQRSVTGLSPP